MIGLGKAKKVMALFIMFLVTSVLMGCTAPKTENEMLEDFINESDSLSFLSFHTLTIDKKQTKEEQKEGVVYATVEGTGEYAEHTYQCVFSYKLTDGEWVLDDVELKSLTISDIQRRSDDEIKETFEQNEGNRYIYEQYDTLTCKVSNVVEPQNEEEIILENTENNENTGSTLYALDEAKNRWYFRDEMGDYFYTTYSCELAFDVSYSSTLSYSASGICRFDEYYNYKTGKWEYGYSPYEIKEQTIDNLENTIFVSDTNTQGYYSVGYLEQLDTSTFHFYEKSFDNNNQELLFEWEEPHKVKGGFLDTYVVEGVDFPLGTNLYIGQYFYNENGVDFKDDSDAGCEMTIDWDAGEIRFTFPDISYSILNTDGESPTGTFREGNAIDLEKRKE